MTQESTGSGAGDQTTRAVVDDSRMAAFNQEIELLERERDAITAKIRRAKERRRRYRHRAVRWDESMRDHPNWKRQVHWFWSKVLKAGPDECWPWSGKPNNLGYGQARAAGITESAHRFAVIFDGRQIPDDMVVDHICRNRICCNPKHLRVVDQATNAVENSLGLPAINIAKTHCDRGHPLEGDNLATQMRGNRIKRRCRECARLTRRERYKRNSGASQ